MAAPRLHVDHDRLRAAYEAAGSLADMMRRLGINPGSIAPARRLVQDAGLPYPAEHWGIGLAPPSMPEDVTTDAQLIAYLETKGYELRTEPRRDDREYAYDVDTLDGTGTFSLGIVSDTHGGSRYAQRTFLETAYSYFDRHEIPLVLHAGDMTGGSVHMHPGMVYEQHAQGADQQGEYVCEAYPGRPGIKTKVISGNHDHSHLKAGGVNVVRRIAEERPDIEYLGMSGAYVTVNGIRIYLHHGSGGVAYARSYKLQKQIEQFSPENKPKVLISGHYHVTCVLESYRNVYGFMAGCFEAQTPYLVEKGLYPEVGFSVLDVTYDEDGAVAFGKRWFPCYTPKENDW